MGAYQRNKGARWERSVVNLLRDAGWEAQRTSPLQAGGVGSDVTANKGRMRGESFIAQWLAIECKVGQKISYLKALRQAEGDAAEGFTPCVVAKVDRTEPTITMRLADFLALVER